MIGPDDEAWMDRALALARLARGTTAPNPSVGAVIVKDGVVLGEGYTQPPGRAHAEPTAIAAAKAAGHDVSGATMYVTLEPCCHHGRTPPCVDAIVAAGIRRVVVGVVDANPIVRGRGIERLRERGVVVDVGAREASCAHQVLGFTRAITAGLPEVTLKVAASIDGRVAAADGASRWITGDVAREDGHRLRAEHDAILVGIGTLLADDPALTCRHRPEGHAPGDNPTPVVFDTNLRTPPSSRIFQHPRTPVIVCAVDAPVRELPARVVRVPREDGRLDVVAALRAVASEGLHRVLVEGGPTVWRALIERKLVDTLHVYVAGVLLPGGKPWLGGGGWPLADAPRLGKPDVAVLGDDVRLTWTLTSSSTV